MYLCETFSSGVFTEVEYSALNSGRKISVCEWLRRFRVPDAAADIFPSRIQSVCGGQRAAEQSSRSDRDQRHLNKRSTAQSPRISSVPAPSTKWFLETDSPQKCPRGSVRASSIVPRPSVLCPESSCQSHPVSPSHFLGKPEQLPAIQRRTEHFKDGWTLTQNTHTPLQWQPFSQNPLLTVTQDVMKNALVLLRSPQPQMMISPSTFLNICDFLWWSRVKNTQIILASDFQRSLFFKSYLRRKSKCHNSDHIKLPFPNIFI